MANGTMKRYVQSLDFGIETDIRWHEMNRFERNLPMKNEATLRYSGGEYDVIKPGAFVRCAISGQPIPLDELRYWSVDLQEAYATPQIAFDRYVETHDG